MKIDLGSLRYDNLGSWPKPVKIALCTVIVAAVFFAGYWFFIKDSLKDLKFAKSDEKRLMKTFESKQEQAANLSEYRKQVKEIKEYFGALLKQLPEKTEVPGLLEDISRLGLQNGLDFDYIGLMDEVAGEYYIELPIRISVKGNYHQLARFVSDVAKIPRIVTMHDYQIKRVKGSVSGENLVMEIIAKTYRYSPEEQQIAMHGQAGEKQ